MPADIDYSNTIIYKITCKDPAVTDVYVGHTTNFVQRKCAHKQSCLSATSVNHKLKVYQVIRANGGWTNWKMEIINFFDSKDHYEARQKEQEYFVSLQATLNSVEPIPKPKEANPLLCCTTCNIKFNTSKLMECHNKTDKHKKNIERNDTTKDNHNLSKVVPAMFKCSICKISCSKKNDWDRHIVTHKHIKKTSVVEVKKKEFICKCGKTYVNNSGLWKHTKICNYNSDNESNNDDNVVFENTDKQVELLKTENYELKNIIIDYQSQIIDLQKQLLEIIKI